MISGVTFNSPSRALYSPISNLARPIITNNNSSPSSYLQLDSQTLLDKLLDLRAKIVNEIETASKATKAELLTCPLAILEVLWGVAELCSTGLFSKLVYAVSSGEELFASGWVAKSLGDYTENLNGKLLELDDLIEQVRNGNLQEISPDQSVYLQAALTGNLRPVFHSYHNDIANKLVSFLQAGVGLMLGSLAFLRFLNKDPGLFEKIEHHPIPCTINEFKEKMFSIFPGKFKEVAEITFLAAPMVAMGIWKKGLASESLSHSLSSTLSGQSTANFNCALEALGNGTQLLFDETSSISSLLGKTQGQGFWYRPIRGLLEIPLCIWMSWNYIASALQMIVGRQKFAEEEVLVTGN